LVIETYHNATLNPRHVNESWHDAGLYRGHKRLMVTIFESFLFSE